MGGYGQTHEGRPLIYAIITHPDNHARLEEIRQNNLKLANPKGLSAAEMARLKAETPVVVSFSYNIHGNEASSTEAAMQVAWRLAAAKDPETEALLKELVFVMFPTVNPDGRDRYSYWYNSVARMVPGVEPQDLEHDEPWPQGRTNHYWFDLNRDWIWGVHPEMRGLTG
ncbi:M14 family zinc carboxypeptidase, partial [Arthrospira platensis SPKY1]|nr:M14 family zinc carboxypeptidase [Arthrospira platensis SPKY1]